MATQNGPVCRYPYGRNLETSSSALTLDGTVGKVAFILPAPKTGNISQVHFPLGSVTTGADVTVSLQKVDTATGDPDGTADQSATVTVADSDDFVVKTATLGSSRAVTRGEMLAVVIEWSSTAGNLKIEANNSLEVGNIYCDRYTSSWLKQAKSPVVVLEYEDGSYGAIAGLLAGGSSTIDFNSGSSPDEVALRIKAPFPVRVMGAGYFGRLTGNVDLVLYSGTTALESVSLDADIKEASSPDQDYQGYFATSVDLAKDTVYRVSVKPTSGTNTRIYTTDVANANYLGQMPGGKECYYSQRTDGGAWSDTATRRPIVYLLLEGFDDGAGGAGLLRHPGMVGGCVA